MTPRVFISTECALFHEHALTLVQRSKAVTRAVARRLGTAQRNGRVSVIVDVPRKACRVVSQSRAESARRVQATVVPEGHAAYAIVSLREAPMH
ncbi:MAG: hypothetical protein IT290_09145 [Deltaproteobacteria bacterium]|nr:hypothetical protein [Deltaproteobacteria bacterium]